MSKYRMTVVAVELGLKEAAEKDGNTLIIGEQRPRRFTPVTLGEG